MSKLLTAERAEELGLNLPPPGLTTAVLVPSEAVVWRCLCKDPADGEIREVRLWYRYWPFTGSHYFYGVCANCGILFLWPDAIMREQMELAGWHPDDLAPSALSGFREGRPSQPRLLEAIKIPDRLREGRE